MSYRRIYTIFFVVRAALQVVTVIHGIQVPEGEFRPNQPPRASYSTASATLEEYHV